MNFPTAFLSKGRKYFQKGANGELLIRINCCKTVSIPSFLLLIAACFLFSLCQTFFFFVPSSIIREVLLDIRHKDTLGPVEPSKELAGCLHQLCGNEFWLVDDFDSVLGDDGAVVFEGAIVKVSVRV